MCIIIKRYFLTVLNIFLCIYVVFFAGLHAAIYAGFLREYFRDRKSRLRTEDKVSIIIPIHNESSRIDGLLRTLLIQSYPAQIVFIDDRSTDDSQQKLALFAEEAIKKNIDCRIITLEENPGANKKQFALSMGIKEADGDYLLFTDGDCEIQPDWVRTMVSRMDEKTGVVIGSVFKKKQDRGFLFLYQCYDHVVRFNYLIGTIGLGAAGGGFGNNMMVSRLALESIGGYEAVPPSPTEDAALISHIRSMNKFKIHSAVHPNAAVETETEKSWPSFFNQTLRWNNGGLFSPELLTRINYNFLMLIIGAGILVIPLVPFFPQLWPMPVTVYFFMVVHTIAALAVFRKNMPKGKLITALGYLLCLLYMPCHLTILTIMGYLKVKTTWKSHKMT